jgi:choline transport protein
MTWSFARDKGTPFSRWIGKVDKRTQVPIVAVGVVTGLAALLCLIYIGSYTAFNDVISLTITGFYGSYFLPCAFLLWHRLKKDRILPYGTQRGAEDTNSPEGLSTYDPNSAEIVADEKPGGAMADDTTGGAQAIGDMEVQGKLVWGPWHLPGLIGIINNTYACVYMIFVIFWSVWPPVTPVTANTMNYSVVVTGGVMILSVIWYFIRGRKDYNGPIIDEDVAPIARRAGSIVAM